MTCRDCGFEMPTARTTRGAGVTIRAHDCKCGSRWESHQRIVRRLPNLMNITVISSTPGAGIPHTGNIPSAGLGEISLVSGSDPIRSLPDLRSNPDPERACVSPTRRKKKLVDYPQEFETLWAAIESNRSKGLKAEALEAWDKAGRPDCVMCLDKWRHYRASLGDTLCKDVCRWFKWGGHKQEYDAAPVAPDGRPPWVREKEERGAREKAASAEYYKRQEERPTMCGYHLYNGEDKRYVLEECPAKCPRHGEQAQAVAHA